ncbi:MAG: hypothetical protein R2716_11925 [Microthrixaceae bacterium]
MSMPFAGSWRASIPMVKSPLWRSGGCRSILGTPEWITSMECSGRPPRDSMIRAARCPTATWAAAFLEVKRLRLPDILDQVPTGECSMTTNRCPGMLTAARIAHWHEDMVEALKCTTSAPSARKARLVSHIARRSLRSRIGGAPRTGLRGAPTRSSARPPRRAP